MSTSKELCSYDHHSSKISTKSIVQAAFQAISTIHILQPAIVSGNHLSLNKSYSNRKTLNIQLPKCMLKKVTVQSVARNF